MVIDSCSLKGCDTPACPRPSAWKTNTPPLPRALPRAMLSQPFGLKTEAAYLNPMTPINIASSSNTASTITHVGVPLVSVSRSDSCANPELRLGSERRTPGTASRSRGCASASRTGRGWGCRPAVGGAPRNSAVRHPIRHLRLAFYRIRSLPASAASVKRRAREFAPHFVLVYRVSTLPTTNTSCFTCDSRCLFHSSCLPARSARPHSRNRNHNPNPPRRKSSCRTRRWRSTARRCSSTGTTTCRGNCAKPTDPASSNIDLTKPQKKFHTDIDR